MGTKVVSRPIAVKVEIEDLVRHKIYKYQGACVQDCEKYFLNLFLGQRKYKIVYVDVL
jgi:heat shock protein HspQ